MNYFEECHKKIDKGSNCAQAVFSTFSAELGFDEKAAHRLATGLGAGFGRKQYLCGAVSAGALLLSLKYGNENRVDFKQKEFTYTKVREFIDWFEGKMNHSSCYDLLGVEILSEEGRKKARELNLFNTVCRDCIKYTAEYMEKELLR